MGSFGVSESNIRGRGKKNKKQNMRLTATPSKEVAQMLTSTTSKQGLDKEVQAACFRIRTWPECPEDNLRELT